MAELNLKQIIDKLNTEFTGETRKLVFWYDDKAEFEADESSFVSLLVLEGEPLVTDGEPEPTADEAVKAKKGDSLFIPAGSGKFYVEGKCSLILTRIDDYK